MYFDDFGQTSTTVQISNDNHLLNGDYTLYNQTNTSYEFTLYSGDISFTMTPNSSVDLNMILYNSDGNIVAANFSNGIEEIDYKIFNSGTYTLKIIPTSSQTTSYTLDINYDTLTVWEKTLDFGPIRDTSVALFDIDNDGKDEIFIGTSKALDNQLNEIRPAGFICLEDDGSIKWTQTFDAISFPDLQTGKIYNTTSVSTTPYFSDIDADGFIDILIGVGADTFSDAGGTVVGQPGDKGGVYALNTDGSIKWFHESLDTIGGESNTGDNRPDGVYGTPVVFDIDQDGKKEVIYSGWDQYVWILNGSDGTEENKVHLLDTIWSTVEIADINKDGNFEILVTADITQNSHAKTSTGGIFHVLSGDLSQNINGFNNYIGNPSYSTLKGKFEDQVLWSTPVTADLDADGYLEIIYGTGNYLKNGEGEYIRVWNHDGSNKFLLETQGRTFSTPLIADLDNDGDLEIVAATLEGYLYAWDHNGNQIFKTKTQSYLNTTGNPIFSSPIAVDLDNDNNLEILYTQGSQIIIVNSQGNQISNASKKEMIFEQYKGSLAVSDIDNNGILNIISGGTTYSKDQAVVYNFKPKYDSYLVDDNYNIGKYQFIESTHNIKNFVERFYEKVLDRNSEANGSSYWVDELNTGIKAGSDVARGFIFSQEFINADVDNEKYINILYEAFFNRKADEDGYNNWLSKMNEGYTKDQILNGFLYSQEFNNLCASYGIIPIK